MLIDLACNNCREKEATYLLVWSKVYKESLREALINPSIICDDCKHIFKGDLKLFENCPLLYSFNFLSQKPKQYIGFLLSTKNKEVNHLSYKFWRKKIWRICYIYRNKKEE